MPFTDVPPSYDSSISRETWNIIAPYIPSADLCACCLVSHKWHSIFIPFLWGDPASHFGIANDAVYVALTRFKRVLRKVRPGVRSLTHTLHLPPALSEIYGGPHATWLRDVLEYLPNLQSLIVNKLPFFDHHALVALRSTSHARRGSDEHEVELPTFGLKLLLACSEPNTTALGLSIALSRFPFLVYLDLSYTKPVRDPSALLALSGLHDLQALKLKGIGLRDSEAEVLANAIGIKVRLLDISDNLLTDMAVRSLMQACFLPRDKQTKTARWDTGRIEDWPVGMAPGPDFFSLDMLRGEELDHELLKQLTNPLTGRLAFEDIPHRGLTHLYIADNRLSVEGLSSLLKSERLHFLDGGSVENVKTIARTRSPYSDTGYVDEIKFPGAEKLIPVLAQSASKNLTYLRVDHALITAKLDLHQIPEKSKSKTSSSTTELSSDTSSLRAELQAESVQVNELPAAAHYPVEMPATGEPIFEMDATPAQPRVELPGDMIYFAVSPPIGDAPTEATPIEEAIQSPIRGEGPYAPEVVVNGTDAVRNNGIGKEAEGLEVILNATGSGVSPRSPPAYGHPHDLDISSESGTGTNSTGQSLFSPVSPVTPARVPRPLNVSKTLPPLPQLNGQAPPSANRNSLPQTAGPSSQHDLSHASSTFRQARIELLMSKRPQPLSLIKPTSTSAHQLLPRPALAMLTQLHPCLLPNLRTLVLTNVPTSVPVSSPALAALKTFISACAAESALSHMLAAIDYSLPPGKARHRAEREAARRLFALKTIILEMEQPVAVANNQSGQRAWEHSRQRLSMSKSSTGDRDSENLWSAAADDFSFFAEGGGEEEDECGIYQHEQDKYFPTANFDEKVLVSPEDQHSAFPRFDGSNGSVSSPQSAGYENRTLSPASAAFNRPTGTLRSPRELPLGRNRRPSNEANRGSSNSITASDGGRPSTPEMMGSTPLLPPPRRPMPPPTSAPVPRISTPNTIGSPPKRHASIFSSATANTSQKHFLTPAEQARQAEEQEKAQKEQDEEKIDIVSSLAAWRRERKTAFDTAMLRFHHSKSHAAHGTGSQLRARANSSNNNESSEAAQLQSLLGEVLPPFVEGYWTGEIKVVRNPTPKGRSGVVDMYGNYFEKGYLYP